ncbi:hypothetical protein SGPA1_51048 [Streptomyces misionensis JCM 4497]
MQGHDRLGRRCPSPRGADSVPACGRRLGVVPVVAVHARRRTPRTPCGVPPYRREHGPGLRRLRVLARRGARAVAGGHRVLHEQAEPPGHGLHPLQGTPRTVRMAVHRPRGTGRPDGGRPADPVTRRQGEPAVTTANSG